MNIAKFQQLTADGHMTPAVARAFAHRTEKKSFVYAYEQEEVAELSQEETRALKKDQSAWRFFEGTSPSYRRVVLHWIVGAKKPETRPARFAKLLEACAAGKRLQ